MKPGEMLSHGKKFAEHVIPALLKPARTLWHEVIGFMFLALAVWPASALFSTIRDLDQDPKNMVRLVFLAAFAAIMLYFGVTSFLRARKISRS